MPFKIRLKKSRQYNVVSKNVFVISVELLDRSVIECTLSSDSTGQDCLNNVCQRVGLQQPEFFGLRFIYKRHGLRWIELSRPLKKQLEKHACEFRLYLAVMFYIPDVGQLKDEVTRYQYFLQLKKDIIEGHLPCTTAHAVMLTAYCLQAEFGNHDAEKHTCEYLKDFVLFPKQVSADPHKLEELITEVLDAHKSLTGLIPSLAEVNYIKFVQRLDGYGYEFFPSKNEQGRDLFLGISLMGILAKYRDSQKSPFYVWTEIVNLTHHKKYLVIECENGKTPFTEFQMEDSDVAKYFWKLCVQQNKFYVKYRHVFSSLNWEEMEATSWRSRSMPNLQNTINHNPLFEMVNSRQHINGQEEHTFPEIPNSISQHSQISYENLASSYSLSSKYSASVDPCHAYSTESLNHGNSIFQLDSQLPSSSSNIHALQSSYLPNFDQRKVLLPAYRAAPDYDTAMKQKYGRITSSQVALSDRLCLPVTPSHSYDSSLDRVQPGHLSNLVSCMIVQQPEVKCYTHYENFEDLAHLEEIDHTVPVTIPFQMLSRNDDASATDFASGIVYQPLKMTQPSHCVAENLKSHTLCADLPIHTYSTPELTSKGLDLDSFGHVHSIPFLQQLKLTSLHSFHQRSSLSTPDLASQSAVSNKQNVVVSSNPNLKLGQLANHAPATISTANNFPLRNNMYDLCTGYHVEEATNAEVVYNKLLMNVVEKARASSENYEANSKMSLAKTVSVPAEMSKFEASMSSLYISNDNLIKSSGELNDQSELTSDRSSLSPSDNSLNNQVKDSRLYEKKRADGSLFLEFEQIPKKRHDAEYTTALLPENSTRNRFKDVLPYEDNRVKVTSSKDNKTGYINASHVTVFVNEHHRHYIASQGPLSNTVVSFWQMVWEHNVQIIVMLTEVKEHGREKCFPYWPTEDNEKLEFGDYQITKQFSSSCVSCITSALSLVHLAQKKQRNIWHIQYTDWPDHGCPEDVHGFLSFMEEIDSVRRHAANEIPLGKSRNLPMIVHCSAGVGRSGVTILSDIMIYSLDHNENLEVSKVLTSLREQRMLTVQTLAQYKFVYSVLIQYLKNSRLI